MKGTLSLVGRPGWCRRLHASGLLLLTVFLLSPDCLTRAGEMGNFTGWNSCTDCHKNITVDWQQSRHARAFESLKKSGQQGLPACIRCHVTGYGETGGFIDDELTPELAGVQCEACHGPAGKHVSALEKKNITSVPKVDICRRCHTPGQDPKFDYAKKIRNIHGAR